MSEKVRYYLEQSVPELEDLKKKGLFDKKEITMIMRRRTDFEHRIQGRGSSPRDFLKYSEFEENLEKLRRKRYSRLAKVGLVDVKPSISDWAGTRRILFIFDRATKRFPGDSSLWSGYLKFAKGYGAIKVIYKVYSRLLQLQPRNVDAWLSAAKYEFEINANSKGTRVLFQRGLRLNPESFELWLAYAQFELTYVARLLARRKVLGLITDKDQKDELKSDQEKLRKRISDSEGDGDLDGDEIALPTGHDDEIREELNHLPDADMNMLGNPDTNPALKGDVALTIFDLSIPTILKTMYEKADATKKAEKTFAMVNSYLNLFDKFQDLNRDYLYLHALNFVQTNYSNDLRTLMIDITLPLRTTKSTSLNFAESLQLSVNKFMAYKMKIVDKSIKNELTNAFRDYLSTRFLNKSTNESTDKIVTLVKAIINKCQAV